MIKLEYFQQLVNANRRTIMICTQYRFEGLKGFEDFVASFNCERRYKIFTGHK